MQLLQLNLFCFNRPPTARKDKTRRATPDRPSNSKGDRWPVAKRAKHYHKDIGVSGFFRCR